ncbi:MAG: alpha/beta hydrolase, partial [Actinomycetota bacterium]|nr:alpha/beta hydrolase [Actinomycetota bacterium]
MPLDPGIAASLQAMAEQGLPPVSASDVPTARAVLRGIAFGGHDGPSGEPPVDSVRSEVIAGSIPVRVYTPDHAEPIPTILLYHGGGFVIGDLDTHDATA